MRLHTVPGRLVCACTLVLLAGVLAAVAETPKADLIIRNANIITVDSQFSLAQALAVRGDRILAVGNDHEISRFAGPNTRVIEAKGKTVLPGLYDSHVHSFRASVSEFGAPMPALRSLAEAFDYLRRQAAKQPAGSWIVLERVYPTRMKEGRLPRKVELDAAAPNHAVYWNCGPVSLANSKALEVSGITSSTPNPVPGEIVRDGTGQPTGLLRNAAQLLKVVAPVKQPSPSEQREAVK